jgi:hypothetical protein
VRKAERQENEEVVELINKILKPAPKNVRRPWRTEEKNEFIEGNSYGK